MSLDVRGVPILSWGEYEDLSRSFDPGAPTPPVIAAWFSGEDVEPFELYLALDVEARLGGATEESHALIDVALARLRKAFPDVSPDHDGE